MHKQKVLNSDPSNRLFEYEDRRITISVHVIKILRRNNNSMWSKMEYVLKA